MNGSYNPANNREQFLGSENKGLFSKMLRNLSSFGVDIESLRNQVGVGINEDPYAKGAGNDMYSFFSQKALSKIMNKKSIPNLNRSHKDKRRILIEYSVKEEIRTYLERICDETIVYNDEQKFCSVKPLPNEYSQDIKDKYLEFFEKIYNAYGFNDGKSAWDQLRKLLSEGYITTEIIWDDKKQYIIGFNEMEAWTIVPQAEPSINALLWVQYPDDPQIRSLFLDSQIIHISYTNQTEFLETSYVEGLIKPYNQLKILEQSKIMFNVMNAQIHQKFDVPVNGMAKHKAEQEIGQLIADYSEDVEWDDEFGFLRVNGKKNIPYNKTYWFPKGEFGGVEMSLLKQEGHDLNENDMLTYFSNKLKLASRIPFQRFESDNGGGTIYNDISSITADEANFNKFLDRIRVIYKELIVKPLRLQMCVEFPELAEDEIFLNAVNISFNRDQLFEKAKKIANIERMAQTVDQLMQIKEPGSEDIPYFSVDWLLEKYLEALSPEELEENRMYKIKYGSSKQAGGGGGGGSDFGGGGDGDSNFGGDGDSNFGDGDLGSDEGGGETQGGAQADIGSETQGGGAQTDFGSDSAPPESGDTEFEF